MEMQPFLLRLGQAFMIMNMSNMMNSIQLSPEGKVDSGGYTAISRKVVGKKRKSARDNLVR